MRALFFPLEDAVDISVGAPELFALALALVAGKGGMETTASAEPSLGGHELTSVSVVSTGGLGVRIAVDSQCHVLRIEGDRRSLTALLPGSRFTGRDREQPTWRLADAVKHGGTVVSAVLVIVQAMTANDHLLDLIRNTPEIDLLLRSSFGFDIHRKHYGESLRLASGAPLEAIAGETAGGAYFLGAEQDGRRPVVYASSEGAAGLLADDLADALEIIIGLEWHDCLSFSGGGDVEVMRISAQHLARSRDKYNPAIDSEAAQVAAALSLRIVPVADLVVRLQAAAAKSEPDYVVIDEMGLEFGPLFGDYVEPRHGGWR